MSIVTTANETAEPVAGLLSVLVVLAACELFCVSDELFADELFDELSATLDELSGTLSELLDESAGSGTPSV